MFTEKQINKWLLLGKQGDNYKEKEYYHSTSLKLRIVEAIVMVERWDVNNTVFIFNPASKSKLI